MLRTKIKDRNKQTKTGNIMLFFLLLKEKEIRFDLEHHIAMTL